MAYYTDEKGMSDVGMLAYFWEERGDLERYIGAEETLKKLPELRRLLNNYKDSMRLLDAYFEDERED